MRSSLNKEFAEFETRRKAVKSEIITPYEAFETVYKDCVSLPYKKADSALKGKVDAIERVLNRKITRKIIILMVSIQNHEQRFCEVLLLVSKNVMHT